MSKVFFLEQEECIACGTCSELCPNCFIFEDTMEAAEIIGIDCPEDHIQEAIDNCPAQCIYWAGE